MLELVSENIRKHKKSAIIYTALLLLTNIEIIILYINRSELKNKGKNILILTLITVIVCFIIYLFNIIKRKREIINFKLIGTTNRQIREILVLENFIENIIAFLISGMILGILKSQFEVHINILLVLIQIAIFVCTMILIPIIPIIKISELSIIKYMKK